MPTEAYALCPISSVHLMLLRKAICPHGGHVQDRDWNAARNILELALRTVGTGER
jgi:transposase